MQCKKKWQVSFSYEVNRLAASNLVDTYEKLFPRKQCKINSNKKIESTIDKQYCLKQLQGYSK